MIKPTILLTVSLIVSNLSIAAGFDYATGKFVNDNSNKVNSYDSSSDSNSKSTVDNTSGTYKDSTTGLRYSNQDAYVPDGYNYPDRNSKRK